MWIETTEFTDEGLPVTRMIVVDGYEVRFTDNGKANVPEDVAKYLTSEYERFTQAESNE